MFVNLHQKIQILCLLLHLRVLSEQVVRRGIRYELVTQSHSSMIPLWLMPSGSVIKISCVQWFSYFKPYAATLTARIIRDKVRGLWLIHMYTGIFKIFSSFVKKRKILSSQALFKKNLHPTQEHN